MKAMTLRLSDEMHELLRVQAFEQRTTITALVVAALDQASPVQGADDRLALGEVLARVDEHDYCHERIREWEAQEQWEKDAHPDEAPSADLEDAEWWNRRADAALAWFATCQQSSQAALNDARQQARREAIEASAQVVLNSRQELDALLGQATLTPDELVDGREALDMLSRVAGAIGKLHKATPPFVAKTDE